MLRSLHIRNLALIREMDVDFSNGLNILTGETGAGKSIIIGSILAAIGEQSAKNLLRGPKGDAYAELTFSSAGPEAETLLLENGYECADGEIVISRRFSEGRSVCRINGETASTSFVRTLSGFLIDIHGQHEYQKLLKEDQQLRLLDQYGAEEIDEKKAQVREAYESWRTAEREASEGVLPEEERMRRLDFLRYEVQEIGDAGLREGEDDELEQSYRRLANAQRLREGMDSVYQKTGYESEGAGEQIGRALQKLSQLTSYDDSLGDLSESLSTIEGLLNDFNREAADYLGGLDEDDGRLQEVEDRLNLVNRLKAKYGSSIPEILTRREELEKELSFYEDYEEELARRQKRLAEAERVLQDHTRKLSDIRKKWAVPFAEAVREQLADLSFARSDFEVRFVERGQTGPNGIDDVAFYLATNPGEPLLPLNRAASGGELSRVMLGILTMFADRNGSGCLIFDEVDAGISGKTAQKVAEKLSCVSRSHQTICITHLPQIASMADHHYGIEKQISESGAETVIRPLTERESEEEIARLIGGAVITDQTLAAAGELRGQSLKWRAERKERI